MFLIFRDMTYVPKLLIWLILTYFRKIDNKLIGKMLTSGKEWPDLFKFCFLWKAVRPYFTRFQGLWANCTPNTFQYQSAPETSIAIGLDICKIRINELRFCFRHATPDLLQLYQNLLDYKFAYLFSEPSYSLFVNTYQKLGNIFIQIFFILSTTSN